jgi:membrane protein implicated in regulation of membrane protease activity
MQVTGKSILLIWRVKVGWLAMIVVVSLTAIALSVARRSHLEKKAPSKISPVGSTDTVVAELAPTGSILVNGELWSACTRDGAVAPTGARIVVAEPRGHLMAVRMLPKS